MNDTLDSPLVDTTPQIKPAQAKRKVVYWFLLVLVVGLALRVVLFTTYPPVVYSDTHNYRRASLAALNGFVDYDGTRMPGYPLYLGWIGSDQNVYLSQLLAGLATTIIFFWLGWKTSGNPAFGALVGLAHTLNMGQLLFEPNLITETLTTFLLAGMLAAIYQALRPLGNQRRWGWWLAAGVLGTLAGLVRPLYLALPFWAALFLALRKPSGGWQLNWRPLILTSLPALLATGIWVAFIYSRFAIFSVTVMNGYHMMQHTGNFFEYVSDENAALRDTYLKYRNATIASHGTQANTIWEAIPEMEQVSGLGFTDLSRKLQEISLDLILKHPDLYLKNVIEGWWLFWRAPFYWQPEVISTDWQRSGLSAVETIQRLGLFGLNLGFLLLSVLALFWKNLRQRMNLTTFMSFIALTLWIISILQSLSEHGDNPRFLVPTQTWVVLWMLWMLRQFWLGWRSRKEKMV
jgi:hypothetical protein